MNQILAVVGTIAVGVAIRFIYEFWVKPSFKKEEAPKPKGKAEIKALKKAAKIQKKAAKQ